MPHPFQCLALARPQGPDQGRTFLLAACGPRLLSTSLDKDAVTSSWTAESTQTVKTGTDLRGEDEELPKKKQKTEGASTDPPNIIKLAAAPDGKHAVAVTEDKAVRVFEIRADGSLSELSQRVLPKRPCALQVLPDRKGILVGDKFGDVYLLPILPTPEEDAAAAAATVAARQAPKPFKPTASNLTVHSKRNLDALESQLQQKIFTPRKDVFEYAHQLLLGHVSMLTDALYVERDVILSPGNIQTRGYIVTADRDEHIRISRGPPQSHVIETFCLGHTQFISKLCLVSKDFIISGGGDDWLGIWTWHTGSSRGTISLKAVLSRALALEGIPEENFKVAVSGLLSIRAGDEWDSPCVLIIICEGIKAFFAISISDLLTGKNARAEFTVVPLDAQPVNLQLVDNEDATLLVSLDQRTDSAARLRAYRIENLRSSPEGGIVDVAETDALSVPLKALGDITSDTTVEEKKAIELLYGIGNLRKRGGWDQDNEG